jgi:hypothetical protein
LYREYGSYDELSAGWDDIHKKTMIVLLDKYTRILRQACRSLDDYLIYKVYFVKQIAEDFANKHRSF